MKNDRLKFILFSTFLCVLFFFSNQYYQFLEVSLSTYELILAGLLIVSHSVFASSRELKLGSPVVLISLLGANDPMVVTFTLALYAFLYFDMIIIKQLLVTFFIILSFLSLNIISEISALGLHLVAIMVISLFRSDRYLLFVVSSLLGIKGFLVLEGNLDVMLNYLPFLFTFIAVIFKSFEIALSYILFLLTGRIESFLIVPVIYSLALIAHEKINKYSSFFILVFLFGPLAFFNGGAELSASCVIFLVIMIYSKFRRLESA